MNHGVVLLLKHFAANVRSEEKHTQDERGKEIIASSAYCYINNNRPTKKKNEWGEDRI